MVTPSRGVRQTAITAEVKIPFSFRVIHGDTPSKRSNEHRSTTRSLNITGLVFESATIVVDGFHLSFTESSFGRNSLEIKLDLGTNFGLIEALGQVEYYEKRVTGGREVFLVGVEFIDMPADAQQTLREYLSLRRQPPR